MEVHTKDVQPVEICFENNFNVPSSWINYKTLK